MNWRAVLRHTIQIAWREARQLLGTPLFWVLAGVFFLASTLVFISLILGFINNSFRNENDISANITVAVIRDLFFILHFFLMIQIPLLTMRAFAEERKSGTLALLMTTPAGEWSIVLGKFLANAGVMLVYLGITLAFPIVIEIVSEPEWPVIFSCYTALALACIAYSAVGIFFSSLTESQVVAAVLSYVALFSLLILSGISEVFTSPHLASLCQHLTALPHITGFLEGALAVEDIAYFILFAFMFLFFSVRQLESTRWRT